MLWGGCNIQRPLQEQDIGALGSFEFRQPIAGMDGVIIGAPHGLGDPDSVDYAKSISEQIGAGLVIASGFASKRLAITQPLIRSTSAAIISDDPRGRGSIYREFKTLLKQTADGPLRLYIGMRFAPQSSDLSQIEVATSGFTFEELEFLKESFIRIRDQALSESPIPKPSIAVDPLDKNFVAYFRSEAPRSADVRRTRAQPAATEELVQSGGQIHLYENFFLLDHRKFKAAGKPFASGGA
jgi:hypothetical protein